MRIRVPRRHILYVYCSATGIENLIILNFTGWVLLHVSIYN